MAGSTTCIRCARPSLGVPQLTCQHLTLHSYAQVPRRKRLSLLIQQLFILLNLRSSQARKIAVGLERSIPLYDPVEGLAQRQNRLPTQFVLRLIRPVLDNGLPGMSSSIGRQEAVPPQDCTSPSAIQDTGLTSASAGPKFQAAKPRGVLRKPFSKHEVSAQGL